MEPENQLHTFPLKPQKRKRLNPSNPKDLGLVHASALCQFHLMLPPTDTQVFHIQEMGGRISQDLNVR